MEFHPREKQVLARQLMIETREFGLFFSPGGGKTAVSLSVINHFRIKTLVIAPLLVAQKTWPDEIAKWDNFNNIKYTVLHGEDKEKNFLRNDVGVYIINFHGIQWLLKMIQKYKRLPFGGLIVDESTNFKNPKAKRLKALKPILPKMKFRYILTGTPQPNSELDLWAQIFILDLGKSLGTSYYGFRNKYFYPIDFRRFNWQLMPGAKEEIREKIAPKCLYVKTSDQADMPELVENDIKFDLPDRVREMYNDMEDKLFATIDNASAEESKVVAMSKSAALIKCAQISQGFVYETLDEISKAKGDKARAIDLHSLKIDWLVELIEELQDRPVLIAHHFKHDYATIKKAIPNMPLIDSSFNVRNWNKGLIPYACAHPYTVSYGLNLQEGPCQDVVFYCPTYDYEKYFQLVERVHRPGNSNDKVMVHRLIARKTVDEAKIISIDRKGSNQKELFGALLEYRKNR